MPGGKNVIVQSVVISFLGRCNDSKKNLPPPFGIFLEADAKPARGCWHELQEKTLATFVTFGDFLRIRVDNNQHTDKVEGNYLIDAVERSEKKTCKAVISPMNAEDGLFPNKNDE